MVLRFRFLGLPTEKPHFVKQRNEWNEMKRNVKDEKTTILFTLYIHRGLREWLFMSLIRNVYHRTGLRAGGLAYCKALKRQSP